MAASAHGMIPAAQVITVTVDAGSWSGIEIVNRDLVGEIWVRLDGTDPVPRAPGSFVVLGARHFPGKSGYGPVQVRLTAEVDRNFSVEGMA